MFYLFCFLSGVLLTALAILAYVKYLAMQDKLQLAELARQESERNLKFLAEEQQIAAEQLQRTVEELMRRRQAKAPETGKAVSIQDRLKKAGELTVKQSKIDIRKGPEAIMQHNELELEKLAVLKTILADGHDPIITIRYNTGDQDMLLSAYVQSINKVLV